MGGMEPVMFFKARRSLRCWHYDEWAPCCIDGHCNMTI